MHPRGWREFGNHLSAAARRVITSKLKIRMASVVGCQIEADGKIQQSPKWFCPMTDNLHNIRVVLGEK